MPGPETALFHATQGVALATAVSAYGVRTVGGDGSDIGAYEADPQPRITAIEKVGPDIRLRFNTVLGRIYRVESEDTITGDGSSKQALDSGAANLPRRFYRGVMLLP